MDKFPRLRKTVMLDKPEFKLADPNNPVRYQLKPQALVPQEQSVAIQKQEEDIDSMEGRIMNPEARAKRMKEALRASKAINPDSVVQEAEIFPNPEFDQVDDVKAVHGNIQDILKLDPDEALDELDNMQEYDLSDNDRDQVRNSVMEYLRQTGKIE